jgi:hypothetical protein
MNSSETNRWMIVLVVALIGSAAWAGEPNVPIHLKFEIGPPTRGPIGVANQALFGRSVYEPLISHGAVYAAAISIVEPTAFLPRPGNTSQMMEFLQYVAERKAGLSAPQKALLKAAERVYTSGIATRDRRAHPLVDRSDPNGPERVILYAVTLDDAQKMAQAYLQYARNYLWRGYLDSRVEKAKVSAGKVERERKRLLEIEQLIAGAQKSLEEFQKTVPYRTESEAHEAIVELDRMLNTARVEMAGILAKMDRITGYRTQPSPKLQLSQEAFAKLDMMLVEEDIALQGAAAREKKATSLREQASRFVELRSTLTSATAEKKPLVESLEADQKVLKEQTREVVDTREQEPKIPSKVVIYPVKWANEPSQN